MHCPRCNSDELTDESYADSEVETYRIMLECKWCGTRLQADVPIDDMEELDASGGWTPSDDPS